MLLRMFRLHIFCWPNLWFVFLRLLVQIKTKIQMLIICVLYPPPQNFIDDVIIKLLGKGNEEKNIVPIEHSMGIWFYFFFWVSVLN